MSELNIDPVTVTVPDALRLSGLGRTKFYELIGSGAIKSITIGTRRLVDFASLKALLKGPEAQQ
jgi:hypothetical protein